MTGTWKESRPDASFPGFSLPPLSCLHLESPRASLPCLLRTDTWVCTQPCTSWTSMENPLLPTCLQAAHPASLPLPATARLSSPPKPFRGKATPSPLDPKTKHWKSLYKKVVLLLWFRYHSNAFISSTDKSWLPSYTHCCMRTQKHLLHADNKGIEVTTENVLKTEMLFP